MPLRIISLNAWGGRLHDRLIAYLGQADPDVLCLQEVVHGPAATGDWLIYRDHGIELPQRANLFNEIASALPHHYAVFSPMARGNLFDGDQEIPAEFGLATFVRRSLAVTHQAVDFVHGEFSPDGFGPHPRSRNAHCLRLHNYADGYPVTIAQMHGLREVSGKGDTPARDRQTGALLSLIHRVWPGGERLIVCGDFNVLPDSRLFPSLAKLGLTDLVTLRGHTDTRTSHYGKAGRFADYMLVTTDVEVVRFDVVSEPEVSDHRALLLDMG